MTQKLGFIPPVEITEDNHVLGASGVNLPVIKADGDWRSFRSAFEPQYLRNFDTYGCTVWNTIKPIVKLEKFYGETAPNHSERYTYNSAEVTPPGSDPHKIATIIRGTGLVDEADLPSTVDTLAEYMTPRPLDVSLRIKGQKWLSKRQLGHQWLWTSKPDKDTRIYLLKDALRKGTVSVSVDAWYKNAEGKYYSPTGSINTHWTNVDFIDEQGIHVDDSYEPTGKILTLDHNIQYAKVYFLTKPTDEQNWFVARITALLQMVGLLQKPAEQVLEKKTELSLNPNEVYNEVKETVKSKLNDFCLAIQSYEGKPGDLNYKNKNPGNIRGLDGKFLMFKTMEAGFAYLKDYVTRASTGKHKAYKDGCTITEFFRVYAPTADNNDPDKYAIFIAKRLGVPTYTRVKDII